MACRIKIIVFLAGCLSLTITALAGPYNEAGVNGYIGDDWQHAEPDDPDAIINPIFRGWAASVKSYAPAPGVDSDWGDPTKALGLATGDLTNIVSLGDLDQSQIDQGVQPGQITLVFGDPCNSDDPNHIRDAAGYDFVIFENGFTSSFTNPVWGFVSGEVFAELGYVEVSTDGVNFVRFPSVSLTAGTVGPLGTIEIDDVFNLAGKHPNGYGTPFDLRGIADEAMVQGGIVDINNIIYVRIVDIPGSGDFNDSATAHIDPCTWPNWANYDVNHPVYDAWLTTSYWGSGGFDLEAIGVLYPQEHPADINLDGIVDYYDLTAFISTWLTHFGEEGWIGRCDMAEPKDLYVNFSDFATFAEHWQKMEMWRN